MKERYDDEKLYNKGWFDSIPIRNYKEVLHKYSYIDYVRKFRLMAKRNKLSPSQRPKLNESEFSVMRDKLIETIMNFGEEKLLEGEKNRRIVFRLLLSNTLDEDWI